MTSKICKIAALLAAGASALCALVAEAQTVSINGGSACNYSTYTKTVASNGVANYNFTATGTCGSGSAPTPAAGTMQFQAASFASVDVGSVRDAIVTRAGFVAGGNNTITGTVTSTTTSICTVPSGSVAISFAEGDTANKTVNVTGVAAGTCSLSLASGNAGTPVTATIEVTSTTAPGQVGFASGAQPATAGQTGAVTIAVSRTGAGSASPAAAVNFSCLAAGLSATPSISPAGNVLNFPAGNGTQNITINPIIPTLSAAPTAGTITCTLATPTAGMSLAALPANHVVNVTSIAAPVCVPTANPASLTAGTAATVNLTSACTNSPTTWEWEALAGAPSVSSTTSQNTTVSFGTSVAAGSYNYRVRAGNGTLGNFATVTVTVGAAPSANCIIRDAAEFPSWAPSPNGTGDTTGSPLVGFTNTQILSFKLPYNTNYASSANPPPPPGTFYGFFVDPTKPKPVIGQPGNVTNGQMITYIAAGGPFVIGISNTPCDMVPHTTSNASGSWTLTTTEPRNGRCLNIVHEQGTIRYHRNDSDITNAVFDGTNGAACRLPLPDAGGYLYVNLKTANPNPSTAATPAGCTSPTCVQLLPRSQ